MRGAVVALPAAVKLWSPSLADGRGRRRQHAASVLGLCTSRLCHADFLVERCWVNTKLAVALHWSLIVDCEGTSTRKLVGQMQSQLYSQLQHGNRVGHDAVNGQVKFKAFMDQFSKEVRTTCQSSWFRPLTWCDKLLQTAVCVDACNIAVQALQAACTLLTCNQSTSFAACRWLLHRTQRKASETSCMLS